MTATPPDRRDLLRLAGAGTAAALLGCRDRPASDVAAQPAAPRADVDAPRPPDDPATLHERLMTPPPGPPLQIAMVMYPQMTALDLVGPQLFLAGLTNAVVHLVAATAAPVATDTGLAIVPTTTFADAPARVDVLFVPGGSVGTAVAMRDPALLGFVQTRGAGAAWITSVCTGALVLGAAGLLRGYRATTHWVAHELLPLAGATAVDARVVVDRDRVTAAGVSAGLDLGLVLAATLRGDDYARALALNAEYAPAPPVRAGTPVEAGAPLTAIVREMYAPVVAAMRTALAPPSP